MRLPDHAFPRSENSAGRMRPQPRKFSVRAGRGNPFYFLGPTDRFEEEKKQNLPNIDLLPKLIKVLDENNNYLFASKAAGASSCALTDAEYAPYDEIEMFTT